jgi:hypothetical protein
MSKTQLENLWREAVKQGFTPEIKKQISEYVEYGGSKEVFSFMCECIDKAGKKEITQKEMQIANSLEGKITTALRKLKSEGKMNEFLRYYNMGNTKNKIQHAGH